jgi:hypothetical protein
MVYRLRGRLVLQGYVALELYGDIQDYQKSDKGMKDTAVISWEIGKAGLASAVIWYPAAVAGAKASGVGWVATRAALAMGSAVTIAAPFTAGYVIGATAGTAIANEVWGEEGAQTALGFYSGGLLPGTETPDVTDYQYIFKPTKPGGPVSLYDVAKKGYENTLRGLGWAVDKRPRMSFKI